MPVSGTVNTANVQATLHAIENDPTIIQPSGHLPTLGVNGGSLVNSRVPALADAVVATACQAIPDTSDAFSPVRFTYVYYATRLQVCNLDQDLYEDPNSIEAMATNLMKIKLEYAFWSRIDTLTGSSSTGGLPDLVAPGNIVDMGGAPLSFPCLERAFSLVTANNGRPTMIMSTSRTLESFRNLCWLAGIAPPDMPWKWYDPARRTWVAGEVTSFRGVPWLINDKMFQGNDPLQRRIYFMVLGDDSGPGPTRGLVRIAPRKLVHSPYIKRVTNGVPDFANADVTMTKDIWMSMPAGLALGSQGALSILTNFAHVGECAGPPPA